MEEVGTLVCKILDMLKQNPVNKEDVEEEIVIDLKFLDTSIGSKMIVDSGVPLSIVCSRRLKYTSKKQKINETLLEYKNCVRRY